METLEFSSAAERAEELTRFLGAHDEALLKTLAGFLPDGRFAELVGAVCARLDVIFKQHGDEDVEGIFTLMLSLLSAVSAAEYDAIIGGLAEAVTAAADKPLLRLKMCGARRARRRPARARP